MGNVGMTGAEKLLEKGVSQLINLPSVSVKRLLLLHTAFRVVISQA